ncbi:MAG: hypothetical protein F6K30_11840 [Cyanothece sp. SIO2G6]|nr:hypothetical protein [Cyanothece sp. SIO2G6]
MPTAWALYLNFRTGLLVTIMQQRLQQRRRVKHKQMVKEAEQDYAQGQCQRGTVTDLMAELDTE